MSQCSLERVKEKSIWKKPSTCRLPAADGSYYGLVFLLVVMANMEILLFFCLLLPHTIIGNSGDMDKVNDPKHKCRSTTEGPNLGFGGVLSKSSYH